MYTYIFIIGFHSSKQNRQPFLTLLIQGLYVPVHLLQSELAFPQKREERAAGAPGRDSLEPLQWHKSSAVTAENAAPICYYFAYDF